MKFLIFVGPEENWKVGIEKKIWGTTEQNRNEWGRITPGDIVAFYVIAPFKSVIGFGRVTKKERNEELVWPKEVREGRSIWPYKVWFDIIHEVRGWSTEGIRIPMGLKILAGMNSVKNEEKFKELIYSAEAKWGIKVLEGPSLPQPRYETGEVLMHPQLGKVRVVSVKFRDGKWYYDVEKIT